MCPIDTDILESMTRGRRSSEHTPTVPLRDAVYSCILWTRFLARQSSDGSYPVGVSSNADPGSRDADVIVVGAGAAGGAAFLEVAAAGGAVIGVDQLPSFGGTAIVSGGGCCVPGTPLQEARGIDDSPGLALHDLVEAGGGEADETWGEFYFQRARAEVHDWLVAQGVRFVDLRAQEDNTVPRWHLPAGNGRGLMDALWSSITARGLADRWQWSTRVTDLIVEDGRVAGIRATADGRASELRSAAVVMATGGFAGDLARVREHAEHLRTVERLLVGGGAGALGLGHRILAEHGAALTHLEQVWVYPTATPDYRDASGSRGLVVRGIEGAIWVNRQGRRFHDESRSGPGTATPALLAQEPPMCWAILDRPMALGMRVADPAFRVDPGTAPNRIDGLLAASPHIHIAATPEDLARSAGIDDETLAATIRRWNDLVDSGAPFDPETGRSLTGLRPLTGQPLYAIQFLPLVRKCLGGVRTDLRCRVLTASGEPIAGLFAAGELAGFGGGGLSGRRALEGIMIGASLFGGRVAGAWAAHAAGFGSAARFGGTATGSTSA
jgi:predicted oxidoreductase